MGPTLATGIPQATSWYMNPYFMATFGAIAALGLVIFAIFYFVFVKLRVGQVAGPIAATDSCGTCGMTGEMISKLIPCNAHSGLDARVTANEKWQSQHDADYRSLATRVNELEKGSR